MGLHSGSSIYLYLFYKLLLTQCHGRIFALYVGSNDSFASCRFLSTLFYGIAALYYLL